MIRRLQKLHISVETKVVVLVTIIMVASIFIVGTSMHVLVKETLTNEEFSRIGALAPNGVLRPVVLPLVFCLLTTMALALMAAVVFSRILVKPLQEVNLRMDQLAQGFVPQHIHQYPTDEIGDITQSLNKLINTYSETIFFAQAIGEGRNHSFAPLSQGDILGKALITMEVKLKEAQLAEEERNKVLLTEAGVAEIIRELDETSKIPYAVIRYISTRVNAGSACYFTADDVSNQLLAAAQYNTPGNAFNFGNSAEAIAEALETRTHIQVPVESDSRVWQLLVFPLFNSGKISGVAAVAGLKPFTHAQENQAHSGFQLMARYLNEQQNAEKTRKLLSMSQKMGFELQQQQEELQRNAVEMMEAQEKLLETNAELGRQMFLVNKQSQQMHVMLENASEIITIFTLSGKLIYVSPSVKRILGYDDETFATLSIYEYIMPASLARWQQTFSQLLRETRNKIIEELEFKNSKGQPLFMEVTGINLNDDPAIGGILFNIIDITERLTAQAEILERSRMQALSENSVDLICRITPQGRIQYVNPVIDTFSNLPAEWFVNRNINNLKFPNANLPEHIASITRQVLLEKRKVTHETEATTPVGPVTVELNGIPECGADGTISTVLVVVHDITLLKRTQNELARRNRNISESISYARRIQTSLLPNTETFSNSFSEWFIYYLPKDVVSGDFPWVFQRGDDSYLAVADCSGHGVPGALISIIGYLLLDKVAEGVEKPGDILAALDITLKQTLKQYDTAEGEGIDIAICRVNKKKKILQFAGACRPLLLFHNNVITDVRGDREAVGKRNTNRTPNYTTHNLPFHNDTTLIMYTDGYGDQFGGPQNKKIGSRRIKEVLGNYGAEGLIPLRNIYRDFFTDWKKTNPQTDDVLMVGIRLTE